jgi:hypothetical protein
MVSVIEYTDEVVEDGGRSGWLRLLTASALARSRYGSHRISVSLYNSIKNRRFRDVECLQLGSKGG